MMTMMVMLVVIMIRMAMVMVIRMVMMVIRMVTVVVVIVMAVVMMMIRMVTVVVVIVMLTMIMITMMDIHLQKYRVYRVKDKLRTQEQLLKHIVLSGRLTLGLKYSICGEPFTGNAKIFFVTM